MSLKTWWRTKSGKAKAVTVLAVLIILNTGLCFLIPSAAEWAVATFHLGYRDPMSGLGLMVIQALLDVVLLVVLLFVAIFGRSGQSSDGG
jgi:uncharacterized membrane protein